jgi:hypothetical protein
VIDPTVEGIANGIEEFARMGAKDIEAMVDRAFERVKKFSWDSIIESYIDLYDKIFGGQSANSLMARRPRGLGEDAPVGMSYQGAPCATVSLVGTSGDLHAEDER